MTRRLPQLDAIRGLAVLVVIFHNTSGKYRGLHLQGLFADGWMGVDLFFVLSGFLINGLLLDSRESHRYFRNFYARRCLRIWPLYCALLLLVFIVLPLLHVSHSAAFFEKRSSPWWSYPFFLQNFLVPVPQEAAGPLGVTWSLAIEEQFYLLWPWVVLFCSRKQLIRIGAVIICASPLLRLVLQSHGVDIYSNPLCRLDGLMAGAVFAVAVRSPEFMPARFTGPAGVIFLAAAPLAVALEAVGMRWIVHTFVVLASVSLLYLALFSSGKRLQAVMNNRFLIYTGTISYGLYLLHKLPFDAAEALLPTGYSNLILPVGLAGSYALSALSWTLLEQPFLRLKRLFLPRDRGRVSETSVFPWRVSGEFRVSGTRVSGTGYATPN